MKFDAMFSHTIRFLILLMLGVFLESCSPDNKPNVILIVVDDLGYADMSCTGLADDVNTPNIDRLAESGVRFTKAYATSPICSPSRAGLITGSYPEKWGTYWYGGPGIHNPEFETIAELLKEQGYTTEYVGKVHYGSYDSDTSNRSFPLNQGFDSFYGFTSARKHYLIHDQSYEDRFQQIKAENNKKGQSLRQQGLWVNNNKLDTLAFSTELFGKQACNFIKDFKDQQFFLQLSFNAVHNFTHQLPSEYLDSLGLAGYTDWDPAKEDYYKWYTMGRYPNNPEGRDHYLGQLFYLDREIGRVMNCLDNFGLGKNTLVIFVSDNGGSTPIYANNFPLRGSKYVLFEGGIRVPIIFSWPQKYEQNKVSDNTISAMDILPTICRAVGIISPENIDGKDISTLLTGYSNATIHDTLVWDTGHEIAVKAGNWKWHVVKNTWSADYEMVELEIGEFLYNLETDPSESINLAEKHPEIVLQLKQYHENWLLEMQSLVK